MANGSSYRVAARSVRGRERRDPPGSIRSESWRAQRRNARLDGQIVGNWVEAFAAPLAEAYLPRTWPNAVLLDSARHVTGGDGPCAGLGFSIFGAVSDMGKRMPWKLGAAPKHSIANWEAFLRSLDGAPSFVVSDDDQAIAAAIRNVWPRAMHFHCEWHRKRSARNALPQAIVENPSHEITRALNTAFHDLPSWDAFVAAAHARGTPSSMPGIYAWLGRNNDLVRMEMLGRPRGLSLSTGPVESLLQSVGDSLLGRAHRLTNQQRTLALLDLLLLGRRGAISETRWAETIRVHLRSAGGRAPGQRRNDDPRGSYSLVA